MNRSITPMLAFLAAASGLTAAGSEHQSLVSVSTQIRLDAHELARLSYEAMGGDQGFARAAAIGFGFRVERDGKTNERQHLWDRVNGRDLVKGRDSDGRAFELMVDLATREGWASIDGKPLAGEELASWLQRAYAFWVNDSYWLMMPAKLLDPGVRLESEGREPIGGASYHKLRVSFDQVGLTPGDVYWAWFDPETLLMARWGFVLEGREPPPVVFTWTDWRRYGPLTLSPLRTQVGGDTRISFPGLEVHGSLPDGAFER